MNTVRFVTKVLALAIFALAISPVVEAQATRTWVSGVGDDANPCSRTAPCKTFAGAISKTATGGEISVLDPGGFGAVTITKAITLDGTQGAGFGSILASSVNGVIVNATTAGAVVILRNLSINGASTGLNGINILAASKVYVENCQIFGFTGADPNGRGIRDQRTVAGARLFVQDSVIKNNRSSGIEILPAGGFTTTITAAIDNVQLTGNGGSGLAALTGAHVTISNSVISGNTASGIRAEEPGGSFTLALAENCKVVSNGTGIAIVSGAAEVGLSNVVVMDNTVGTSPGAGSIFSFGNNKIAANGSGNGPVSAVAQQ